MTGPNPVTDDAELQSLLSAAAAEAGACDPVPGPDPDIEAAVCGAAPAEGPAPESAAAGDAPQGFDVCRAPIAVPTLLEASAGTGKTYSIKHLALRCIVELDVPVTALLVMTFTRAATAELRARIHAHLTDALALLTGETDESAAEGLLVEQRALWREAGIDDATAAARIRDSLASFDNCGIVTIHGFCQKSLDSAAFSAGGAVGGELRQEADDYVNEVVDEFIRTELAAMPEVEDRREFAECGEWAGMLCELARSPAPIVRPVLEELDTLRPAVRAAFERFVREAPERFARRKREAQVRTYDDLLVDLCERLTPDPGRPETVERAERLARSLRGTYRAALVDEFQDTDPVQFRIIERLFLAPEALADGRRAIWFVGDPKQAIYSFRQADLATYLRARDLIRRIGRVEALDTNYRSSPALVDAFNAFWLRSPGAFLHRELDYVRVKSSPKNTPLLRRTADGFAEVPPFEWYGTWREPAYSSTSAGLLDELEVLSRRIMEMIEAGRRGELLIEAGEDEARRVVCERDGVPLRGLTSGDIAVLVRSNNDAAEVEAALRGRGIRVRKRELASVCRTEEAHELCLILRAFAAPGDARALLAARTTRIIGDDCATAADIAADEARRIALRRVFEEGARAWSRSGPAGAVGRLMAFCRTAERLLPEAGGERAAVNYDHLLELLHAQARTIATPGGLAAWLEAQRDVTNEAYELRLESDADLVLVQTIHSSKGLQYPVVFIMGAHKASAAPTRSSVERVIGEHGEKRLVLTLSKHAASPGRCEESRQESVRLAYVAMTRAAKYLCILSCQRFKSPTNSKSWHALTLKSPYCQALAGTDAPSENAVRSAAFALEAEGRVILREIASAAASARAAGGRLPSAAPTARLEAAPAADHASFWRTSSFTGITRLAEDDAPGFVVRYGEPARPAPGDDILDFPKGAQAGTCLHEMLELADFAELAREGEEAGLARLEHCRRSIARHLSFPNDEARECAVRGAASMLFDVLNAELAPGLFLRDVPPEARSAELEFLMPIPKRLTAERLAEALRALDPRYDFGVLRAEDLRGFLTGFIDLVIRHNGRFYVIDWKSNRIADRAEGYDARAMSEEMARHLYRLQYLIYLVALRRFLMARLGDRFRSEMIGGAIYVFLRGVRADTTTAAVPQGVEFDPADPAVIERLDRIFAGEDGYDR